MKATDDRDDGGHDEKLLARPPIPMQGHDVGDEVRGAGDDDDRVSVRDDGDRGDVRENVRDRDDDRANANGDVRGDRENAKHAPPHVEVRRIWPH